MPKLLSYNHAKNAIRLMYKKQGFKLYNEVPGDQVSKELGIDIKNAPFAALYAFIDEYITLLRCQSLYFLSANHEKSPLAMTFYRLSIRQLRNLTSIRILCSHGLDANARIQLRLLYETAILWVRFRIDENLSDEYVACTSSETANHFWHKYLSKEKTEKYLNEQMKIKGFNWPGEMDDQIQDLKKKMSLFSHPTFLADYHETLIDWRDDSEKNFITEPLASSYFTLSKAIFVTILPFSIFPDPSYDLECNSLRCHDTVWNPIPHPTLSWEDYNQNLRNMFPSIFLIAIKFFEGFDISTNN